MNLAFEAESDPRMGGSRFACVPHYTVAVH
jgi:hypothetical protein